jgi:hypothetical protein
MIYVTEMRKYKSKVCFVESSFGQKVWSIFARTQCLVASPFLWQLKCMGTIQIFINPH